MRRIVDLLFFFVIVTEAQAVLYSNIYYSCSIQFLISDIFLVLISKHGHVYVQGILDTN
jgi:hypothetical protein